MEKIAIFAICFLLFIFVNAESENDRFLSLPEKKKCDNRLMEAKYEGRNFFFSGHDPELKTTRLDWLDARNECRKRCMETISFKDQKKFDFFKSYIQKNNISFIWTSGRICDFAGCEGRWDLLPKRIKGWLWSADQTRIDDTNKIPTNWSYTPWSRTGHSKKPQPDNAEFFLSQVGESCLGVLNNQYNDSVAWHDIACYHKARFICEDSEPLLYDVANQGEEEATNAPVTTSSSTTTIKSTTISKVIRSSTEATEKQIEATEKIESSSTKALDFSEAPSTTTQTPEEIKTTKKRRIIRRRRTRVKTSSTTTTLAPTTTQLDTTEKSTQPLDSPSNDIQLEETTKTFEEDTTTQTTTSTTSALFRRKLGRRTRRKLNNF